MKYFTKGLDTKIFAGKSVQKGVLHISDLKKYPIKAVGSANDINPPNRIFYATKAIVMEDFTIKTYPSSFGNGTDWSKVQKDQNGQYFENIFLKGSNVILQH